MMFKINSLCREQKQLKEYRRKLLKRKRKSSELSKEKEAAVSKANDGNQSKRNQEHEEESKTIEKQKKDEPMDVVDPISEDKSHDEEPVLEAPDDEEKLSVHDLGSEDSEKLQTKMEPIQINDNVNKEVVFVETVAKTKSDQVVTLLKERHENEPLPSSHSRASCSVRGSVKFRSIPRVIPSITSQRDTGFIPERKMFLSPVRINRGTGLKSEGKGQQREKISTNLIKLQCTSNYKLLCRLVDAMAHRQLGSNGPFKPSKPGLDQERFKEQEMENHNLNVDSLPCLCKTGVEKHKNGVVSGCPRHSSRTGLQSSFDEHQVTRDDMTGKRVLPPISEKGTNRVRHDINRYLRAVSPVDPLLKRLSHYEKVNKVTWKSAFSSLKSLKCL